MEKRNRASMVRFIKRSVTIVLGVMILFAVVSLTRFFTTLVITGIILMMCLTIITMMPSFHWQDGAMRIILYPLNCGTQNCIIGKE